MGRQSLMTEPAARANQVITVSESQGDLLLSTILRSTRPTWSWEWYHTPHTKSLPGGDSINYKGKPNPNKACHGAVHACYSVIRRAGYCSTGVQYKRATHS